MGTDDELGGGTDASPAPEGRPSTMIDAAKGRPDWLRRGAILGIVVVGVLLFRPVLVPFCVAVLLAYLLAPPVALLQGVGLGRLRIKRWLAVLVVYASLLAFVVGVAALFLPRLWIDTRELATRLPAMAETVRTEWIPQVETALGLPPPTQENGEQPTGPPGTDPGTATRTPLVEVVPRSDGGFSVLVPRDGLLIEDDGGGRLRVRPAQESSVGRRGLGAIVTNLLSRGADYLDRESLRVLGRVREALTATAGGILVGFFVFVGSSYLLATAEQATAFAASLVPPARRPGLGRLVAEVDRGLAGVVRGQVVIALTNGLLSGVGFLILGVDHWVILTGITATASIVPVFGSLIAAVPAVLIALEAGPGTAALVVVWLLGIHQLEASVLNPRIMGDAARLSPVLVLFALLAGERTLGPAGLLLAVPALSVISTVLLHVRDRAYTGDAGGGPAAAAPDLGPREAPGSTRNP